MASLDCDRCDGAGCIPADHVREELQQLARDMALSPVSGTWAWSQVTDPIVDRLTRCPITAGEALFRLAVDLHVARHGAAALHLSS